MDNRIVYEKIIEEKTIRELKKFGLTENGIIAFADDIMERYFNSEYLEKDSGKIREYNEERPHDSLNDLTPWEYFAIHKQGENSNLGCH